MLINFSFKLVGKILVLGKFGKSFLKTKLSVGFNTLILISAYLMCDLMTDLPICKHRKRVQSWHPMTPDT